MPAAFVPLNGTAGTEGNAALARHLVKSLRYDTPAYAILTSQLTSMAQGRAGGVQRRRLYNRVMADGWVDWTFHLPGILSAPLSMRLPSHIARTANLNGQGRYEIHLHLNTSLGFFAMARLDAETRENIRSTRFLVRVRDTDAKTWMGDWTPLTQVRGNACLRELYERASAALRKAGRLPAPDPQPQRNSSGDRQWDLTLEALSQGTLMTTSGLAEDLNIADFVAGVGGKYYRVYFPKFWTVGAGGTAWFRVDEFGVVAVLCPPTDDGPEDDGGEAAGDESGEEGGDDTDEDVDFGVTDVDDSAFRPPAIGDFRILAVAQATSKFLVEQVSSFLGISPRFRGEAGNTLWVLVEGSRSWSYICDTSEGRFTINLGATCALGYADAAAGRGNRFLWRLDLDANKMLVAREESPDVWASTGDTSRVARDRIRTLAQKWKAMAAGEGLVV